MSKSQDNRRRRLHRARDLQNQMQHRANKHERLHKLAERQLSFARAEIDNFCRVLGRPKLLLSPALLEEQDYNNGDWVRTMRVRRLRWDGFRLTIAGEELCISFRVDRRMADLMKDADQFLEYQWKNIGSKLGIDLIQWLREQKPVDTQLTPMVGYAPIRGPVTSGRQPTDKKV